MLSNSDKLTLRVKLIKKGITCDAVMTGFNDDKCLVVLPERKNFRVLPGDDIEVELPSGAANIDTYRATVARVEGDYGEKCLLKDLSSLTFKEKRQAQRFPVQIAVEYCLFENTYTGENIAKGMILNLSKLGLLFRTKKSLEAGMVIIMMFDVNWDDIEIPVGVVGTVLRKQVHARDECGKTTFSYGVKFNSPRVAGQFTSGLL
ncbi:MAG TPA: PilZ domain-containing protein [Firmicutes bacterium]|nr:PilZ domain-containing protein [Bacillota bacterium]